MSKTTWSKFDVSKDTIEKLQTDCPPGTYCTKIPDELPAGILPDDLLRKCPSVLITNSGTPQGDNYLFLNLNRLDGNKIDQMPFVVVQYHDSTVSSGFLRQHSKHHHGERTISLPSDFDPNATGLYQYQLTTMPNNPTGMMEDISNESQIAAREMLYQKLLAVSP